MPELPKRKPRELLEKLDLIKLSQFIDKSDMIIKLNIHNYVYIDNLDVLREHFDIVKRMVAPGRIDTFYTDDVKCIEYVEEHLGEVTNVTLSLIDDFENKDRSYLDLRKFEKIKVEIPFSYVLWTPHILDNQKISLYSRKDRLYSYCSNSYENVSLDNLKRIRDIISGLSEKYKGLSDLEKTILISNYLQNRVQYVDEDNVSVGSKGMYITDSRGLPITYQLVGSPETVLLQDFGLCCGIGNATTLLLNNPEMNVNMRSVHNWGHIWNVVCLDGKYYFVDNTWNITRNKDQYPASLKAKSFSSDYLFFGTDTAKRIGHHIPDSYCPVVEKEDMSRSVVNDTKEKLLRLDRFSDYNKPVFKSRLKK